MSKYAISQEGAESLRNLAQRVNGYSDAVVEAGDQLQNGISGLNGLGVYEDQILELIGEVDRTQHQGEEAVQTVVGKLNAKAEEIDALVNAGLA